MQSFDIDDPIAKLNQIGSKRAKAFSNHQIHSIRDLLYYFPRKHLDRTNITQIKNLSWGGKYNIFGYVEAFGERSTRYKKIFQVILSDGTGLITLTWFNSGRYLKKLFKKDDAIAVHGKVDWYNGFTINHPEFDILDKDDNPVNTGSIIPIYSLTNELRAAGIEQRLIRNAILEVFNFIERISDMFVEPFIKEKLILDLHESLKQIHYPESLDHLDRAVYRLKFE